MRLTIKLSGEVEQRLRAEAARKGEAPEEFARLADEEKLTVSQNAHGGKLAALLRQWREEPLDPDEAEGYPLEIEPLRLREVSIDP
ncbi:MAG: hypothetical protein ACO1SX_26685 [Actinomycetota bacterium]